MVEAAPISKYPAAFLFIAADRDEDPISPFRRTSALIRRAGKPQDRSLSTSEGQWNGSFRPRIF
jgi:hypothetical protein